MNKKSGRVMEAGLTENGDLHTLIDQFNWQQTALGNKSFWPAALKVMVNTCLCSRFPVLILWGEDMVQLYNDAYSQIIGLKHPAALGARVKDVWNEQWDEIEPMLQSVLKEGKSFLLEERAEDLNCKNLVEQYHITFVYSPIYNETKKIEGILVSATAVSGEVLHTDNTRHLVEGQKKIVKLEEKNTKLKNTEGLYHTMIDEVQDYAIIFLDKDGIIQNWNKGAQKIKQYNEAEAVGRHFRLFYLPQDCADKLPERLLNQARNEGKASYEGWRLRKDGTRFWGNVILTALHNEKDEVIGFSKITRDLTERKTTEDTLRNFADKLQHKNETLKKSEERYHQMIAEVQDYAIILLDDKGYIQNWNTGAEKIKGYSADEIIGKNFNIFYPTKDREDGLPERLLARAVKNGKAVHEGWRMRKDGSRFWGSIVLTALHSSDGAVIGFSKVTRDLTERKIAEDKMQEYMLMLETQNKELEQFVYVASHDLQEPLRKIQTFVDVITTNIQNDAIVKKYFEKINSSAQRMTDLIKSVLNYSRLSGDGEEIVNTDLNLILSNILSDFELLIQEKNATIISELLPIIGVIPLQANQLFSNLIGNALKFSKKEPAIRISSKILTKAQMINPPAHLSDGRYLEIIFTDNGIGFDQQYEKLIFSMFQRLHAKHEYSGTGIGLALCKKIAENHGGFIRAKGELGKGSSFYVYFLIK